MTTEISVMYGSEKVKDRQGLVVCNMQNKFWKDTWKTFQVIAPTRSNYWHTDEKIRNKAVILIFLQPVLNLSENWLLVTYMANLGRIHEKLLSRP